MNLLHFVEFHPIISVLTAVTGIAGSISLAEMFEPVIDRLSSFVIGLFFVQKYMIDNASSNLIYNYLNAKFRGFGVSQEMFGGSRFYIHPLEDEYIVWNRNKSNSKRLWFFKGRPILFWPNDDDNEWGSFLYFRWTVDWNKLLKVSAEHDDLRFHSTKKAEKKFYIKNHVGGSRKDKLESTPPGAESKTYDNEGDREYLFWKPDDLGVGPKPDDPMGHLSINKDAAKLIRKVKHWFNNKDWYKDRNIIWKLGVLLFGLPGGGKTTLIRAIAEDLDIPLHTFDLSSMDSDDFVKAWKETQADKPRIVVFEDFDTVFHGRENQIEGSTLEFGTILNAIDGLQREHGLLLFITTNHVDKIDEAMGCPRLSEDGDEQDSTRPGRIDIVMKMAGLDKEGRAKIAHRILPGEYELGEVLAERYSNDTPAQFQYRCMKKALDILWGTDDGEI